MNEKINATIEIPVFKAGISIYLPSKNEYKVRNYNITTSLYEYSTGN